MIMTKLGNQPDSTKIMYANNEIQKIYYNQNIVWENQKTAKGVITNDGRVASGSNITGGQEHKDYPVHTYFTPGGYMYMIGDNYATSEGASWTIKSGTTTVISTPINLGIYAGKYIKNITSEIAGYALKSRLKDQSDGRVKWEIKDNNNNVLWSKDMRIGDASGDYVVFSFTNFNINVNKKITELKCSLTYYNISLESDRIQNGACYIGFRNMNIIYK